MNNYKKVVTFLCSFTMVLSLLFVSPFSAKAGSSTSWNFKDTAFKNLGTISSSTTVNSLGLIATSGKTMSVKSNSVTVSGTSYTYCLALGGSGCTSYRAVKVPVSGKDTIKVVLDAAASRTLVVANGDGSQIGTISAGTTAALRSYSYSGNAGYVYLYSSNSNINLYKIQVDSSNASVSTPSAPASPVPSTPTGSQIVVSNGGTSLSSALSKAKSGTVIVIDGTVKSGSVSLPAGVIIQGKNNAVIDFSQTSGGARGITIADNGCTLQDITVKNAADNGIYVTGSSNTFRNVTTCYNKDAGVQICNGGADNKFYNCHSHHNADSTGENADGFACKLHSGTGNYFESCIADYNADDGWDCYAAHGAVTFVNCQANYNGNCNGIKGDGNGFKLGGVDNKTSGVAAHLDPLQHKLTGCSAKGNTATGFDRNNQNGVVTMIKCTADSNGKKNFGWPLTGTPSALGYKVTFGKAIIQDCTSINGKNDISGATLKGTCIGF